MRMQAPGATPSTPMARRILVAAIVAAGIATASLAQTPADSAARQRLQRQQLEDALRLDTQQSLAPRSGLAPRDARRIDELQARQRMEQLQLEQDQLNLQQQRAHDPGNRALDTQQRLLDQQRELQLQRFQLEQDQLLRSMKSRPLQRSLPNGSLQP